MLKFDLASCCEPMPKSDSRCLIAPDRLALIAHLESDIRLINAMQEREQACSAAGSLDLLLRDDVTPRYVEAGVRDARRVDFGRALQGLPEFGNAI